MTGHIEVFVAAAERNVLAGRLYPHRHRGAESASFVYADSYLAGPESYALDPALPLVAGTLQTPTGRSLFGAFTDSSPDRWGRMLIARAERARAEAEGTAPRALSEVGLLLGVRDDLREGALRFRLDDEPYFRAAEDSGVPALIDLPVLLDIGARAESDSAGYEQLKQLIRAGSSLGGARPKAHVITASGHVAIAKFPSATTDTWNVMAWEKVALDLARAADVTVESSQLIRIGDRHVLIADRFDRRGAMRVGYASAMTMLEAGPGDQRSYLEIAEVIEERSSAATRDLQQLWRRIAFSVLISNTDDHLRNHGFLHERGESWRLSPAFDLNPNPDQGPKYLSTAIDFTDTRARVDTLLSVASYFRVDAGAALVVLADVINAVAAWRDVAKSHGLMSREIELMKPAFEHPEAERARNLTHSR
jgi:serine/threonine-protein kinase HipA